MRNVVLVEVDHRLCVQAVRQVMRPTFELILRQENITMGYCCGPHRKGPAYQLVDVNTLQGSLIIVQSLMDGLTLRVTDGTAESLLILIVN